MTSLSVSAAQATKEKRLKPRIKRILEKRAPKVVENVKTALFLKGEKSSECINNVMRDLSVLKKPHVVVFSKKNKIHPFEDVTDLEKYSKKKDSSLMLFGSHSKKRPHNLVFCRFFDYQVLDLIEVGVTNYQSIAEFAHIKKNGLGMKPCFIFQGEEFEQNPDYKKLSNVILDMFRGESLTEINLAGLEHVIICTAVSGVIHFRHYAISLKKSGTKYPHVELEEIGPCFDMTLRRTRFGSIDLLKTALAVPKELKKKKEKNLKTNVFGQQLGRIHMPAQDINKLQTRKMKGLKRKRNTDSTAAVAATTTAVIEDAEGPKKQKK